ncbi:hypothetical protein KAR91_16365 [Candidatus Pacearchaeota archaeon]|nr:hypothetical protein [Candidatus Pacearchaeota archaeon]
MSGTGSIQAHESVVATNPDFVTATESGTKRALDVNILSGAGTSEAGQSVLDADGQDAYVTVLTPTKAYSHILVSNAGSFDAVVSLDAGATDGIAHVPAGSVLAFDDRAITTAAIQAKNYVGGSNFTLLAITVW